MRGALARELNDKKAAFAVGFRKARRQQLEATIENPLNMPLEAIPEDVNSLNGLNEVGCSCVCLILTLATTLSSTPLHAFSPSFCTLVAPNFFLPSPPRTPTLCRPQLRELLLEQEDTSPEEIALRGWDWYHAPAVEVGSGVPAVP